MGYDFHITRAADWTQSEQQPISEAEWRELVDADPTLEVCQEDYYARESNGQREQFHPVIWVTHPGRPCFWHMDGKITKKYPDDALIDKMIEIAQKLNARVLGDDGEEYTAEGIIEAQ